VLKPTLKGKRNSRSPTKCNYNLSLSAIILSFIFLILSFVSPQEQQQPTYKEITLEHWLRVKHTSANMPWISVFGLFVCLQNKILQFKAACVADTSRRLKSFLVFAFHIVWRCGVLLLPNVFVWIWHLCVIFNRDHLTQANFNLKFAPFSSFL